MNIRSRINYALNAASSIGAAHTRELIGCTIAFLREYIEMQFKPGMTWQNRKEWHIDHILPIIYFDLQTLAGQKQAFHYSNMQPLWAEENMKKGKRLPCNSHPPAMRLALHHLTCLQAPPS